jgi:hypothetical protein
MKEQTECRPTLWTSSDHAIRCKHSRKKKLNHFRLAIDRIECQEVLVECPSIIHNRFGSLPRERGPLIPRALYVRYSIPPMRIGASILLIERIGAGSCGEMCSLD